MVVSVLLRILILERGAEGRFLNNSRNDDYLVI